MNDELKAEFKGMLDDSIKANLEEIVGKEIADKIEASLNNIRARSILEGRDIIGVDADTKIKFVQDIRNISRGEKAAYLESSDQTGGYLVPTEVHAGILRIAETVGIIARDSRRWPMGSDTLEIPRYTGAAMQGEYVGEDEEGDETQNDLGVARLNAKVWMLIYRIGNTLLSDANVSIADWLMTMAAEGMAYRLDREGFVGGTFVGSPFVGILQSPDVTVQTLAATLTGFEDLTVEEASNAIANLPTAALGKAAFYFHRSVWARIRAQKSGDNYVFGQSNLATLRRENGIQPVGEILGYPVFTTDVLPAYSTSGVSKKFGVFGNLELALAWGDRGPMEVAKSDSATVGGKSVFRANQTAVRFTHRHAITMQLPAAAVVLKTAAS